MPTLSELVTFLDEDIQPSDSSKKLSQGQLERAIMGSLARYNPNLSLEELSAEEVEIVLTGAKAQCCWLLAAKYAEGMWFQIQNDEYHGEMPHKHYMNLAEMYEKRFEQYGGTIHVSTVTRRDVGTGKKVPLYPDDSP